MTELKTDYTVKSLHELFCYAQTYLPENNEGNYFRCVFQDLLTELERMRPLGSDGKHGELHTDLCGCEDK